MQYITTTQLRTLSSDLIAALAAGDKVDLIHRSRVVAEIKPKMREPKPFNAEKFLAAVKKLNFPKLTIAQARANYHRHIMEKYGKNISRH